MPNKSTASKQPSFPTSHTTFIIGNGFDINLGMKTKYSDMYEGYIKTPSQTKVIESFKNELRNQQPFDKWSDFEMAMAEYAKTLSSEKELIECVRDFKSYMVNHLNNEYLKLEQMIKNFKSYREPVKELNESIRGFYRKLIPNTVNEIDNLLADTNVNYHFLTFNYTFSSELFFAIKQQYEQISLAKPIHIHGTLANDVVLGIDNVEQIEDLPYTLTTRGRRSFVKTVFNGDFDRSRVEKAKQIIKQSSVICVYGWSMGESDQFWVDLLREWITTDPRHHLVCYQYGTKKYQKCNFDEIMDAEDEQKEIILDKLGLSDWSLLPQIHIPIGENIFKFGKVESEDQIIQAEQEDVILV